MPRNWISRLNFFVARGNDLASLCISRADHWWGSSERNVPAEIQIDRRSDLFLHPSRHVTLEENISVHALPAYRYELTRIRPRLPWRAPLQRAYYGFLFVGGFFRCHDDVNLLGKSILFASRISFAFFILFIWIRCQVNGWWNKLIGVGWRLFEPELPALTWNEKPLVERRIDGFLSYVNFN